MFFTSARTLLFIEVTKMTAGNVFGQVGIETGARRNANCITETKCEFAVLDFEDYERVLKKVESKIIQNKATFLNKIPYY